MAGHVDVQVVLYGTPRPTISRLTASVAAASRHARETGHASQVSLHFGDCSPEPAIDREGARSLAEAALASGLSDLSFEHFGANLGHGGGNNRLARTSTSDVIVVLGPRTYVAPTLLVRMLEALAPPDVGIVEARRIPLDQPKDYDPVTGETSWATRSCLALDRRTYDDVGGFDDATFFVHGADVDLSWRVRLAGLRVIHVPGAVVFHDEPLPHPVASGPSHSASSDGVSYDDALGSLMLAWKARRSDIVSAHLERLDVLTGGPAREAAAEYRRVEDAGLLPSPYPEGELVTAFCEEALSMSAND